MRNQLKILSLVLVALLEGCGAVQVKTNMPVLKSWLDDEPQTPLAYQRPASTTAGQPSRPAAALPAPRIPTTASPAQAVAPIPAPLSAKRKAVAKKPVAVVVPLETSQPSLSSVTIPKPNNPWAIAPQP